MEIKVTGISTAAEMEKELIKEMDSNVRRTIGSFRCPGHNAVPTWEFRKDGGKLEIVLSGCCEEHMKNAHAKLAAM